jgi:mono/diheme cytochrome c family protein
MATAAFVIGFLALGAAVAYVAFWGGPGGARQAYLTRGRRAFRIAIPILYIALGIAVPALVLADGNAGKGGNGALASQDASKKFEDGRDFFRQACWSCHTLKAANATGVAGPDLDSLAPLSEERVSNAVRDGGQKTGRMPAGLLQGKDREAVAYYVAQVAGR